MGWNRMVVGWNRIGWVGTKLDGLEQDWLEHNKAGLNRMGWL